MHLHAILPHAFRRATVCLASVIALSFIDVSSAQAAEYYVAVNGAPTNDGSINQPWDLTTALAGAGGRVHAGDTIWLRGGTYVGNFASNLTGTTSAPIIVRAYPGERATIDANTALRTTPALTVNGSDTWYWGFEVTDSNTVRMVTGGYNPPRATSVWVVAPRTKFINMIVHDGEQGFGFWEGAVDAEIYGNLIYNVGFESDDRGHGHSIYANNRTGVKRIVDNIMLNGFSFGLHAYTSGGEINNLYLEGNTAFNHGTVSRTGGAKVNMYLRRVAGMVRNPTIRNNYLYYSPFNSPGRNIQVYNINGGSVTGNYSAGGTAVHIWCFRPAEGAPCSLPTPVTSNSFYGTVLFDVEPPPSGNVSQSTKPNSAPVVFVRPNQYEPGRANITIFNWSQQPSVAVDLSQAGLPVGSQFEVRDAQNYFGTPAATGTYTGAPVTIPMTGLTAVPPIGNIPIVPTHTGPEFGAFILLRTAGDGPSLPTASLNVSPTSISQGQSATLSWSTSNATSVSIDQGIGSVPASGSRTVSPSATTTYTLTATNQAGSVTRNTTLTVQGNSPPTVNLTSPSSGASFTAPATIALAATASDSDGTVAQVRFYSGSTLLTTDTTPPYSYTWSNVPAGTYDLTARATDNQGATFTSATVTVTVVPAGGGGTSATFVRMDSTTRGNWKGVYGGEGYGIAYDQTARPSYAQLALSGESSWLWNSNTSDVRALERAAAGEGRVAATWYSATTFFIDVTVTDGRRHQVALYAMDWDQLGSPQTIEVLNGANGALLDTRTLTNFQNGQYWVWQVGGRVRFRISRSADPVVAGIFFGATGGGGNNPPTVSLTTPGTSFTAPARIELTATASDSDGTVTEVSFFEGSTLLATDTTNTYSYTWMNVGAGTYTLTARATDNGGASTASAPPIIVVVTGAGGGPPPGGPQIVWPQPDQIWVDVDTWVEWVGVPNAQAYQLLLGTTEGGRDIHDSGEISATEHRVENLPLGETVHARVLVKVAGVWRATDITFTVRPE